MQPIGEYEATIALGAHLDALHDILLGGWQDLTIRYEVEERIILDSTTEASIIHCHHIERASRYAQSVDGVRLEDLSRLKMLVIDDRFAIRFKKFDEGLHSSNLRTEQIETFRRQEQLPGLPPTCNLEAGYVLNRAGTEIQRTCLVFPNGPNYYWAINLNGKFAKQTSIFNFSEHTQHEEVMDEEEVVIKPRKDDDVIVPSRHKRDEN